MCKKIASLIILLLLLTLSSVFASTATSSVWLGIKSTSAYTPTITYGAQINDDFILLNVEEIGKEQLLFNMDLNFRNNKTLRQELIFSNILDYKDWINTNISYLIGQDLSYNMFYLKYRIGVQLGLNYLIPLKHIQSTLTPTLYFDTGFNTNLFKIGIRVGSISNTESTLQILPIISPYLSFPINNFAFNLGVEIKLSDFLYAKVFPVSSIAGRIGISYTGGNK